MKLHGYDNDTAEVKEYKGPSSVYQSEFKGQKVAIKVTRLYVSQKLDEPLSVSVVSCLLPFRPLLTQ